MLRLVLGHARDGAGRGFGSREQRAGTDQTGTDQNSDLDCRGHPEHTFVGNSPDIGSAPDSCPVIDGGGIDLAGTEQLGEQSVGGPATTMLLREQLDRGAGLDARG